MSAGQVVRAPDGTEITLVDIGQQVLCEGPGVRVWSVALRPGEVQPWHLHHNPYLVLSLETAPGRMDWLDGSAPRFLDEYVGGAVYRPVSPVHRLTNIGTTRYVNRLVEFTSLGEERREPLDIGPGARSARGERPPGGPEADGRERVLWHPHARVWEVEVPAEGSLRLALSGRPHVLAGFAVPDLALDPTGGVRLHDGGPVTVHNPRAQAARWFVVELTHLDIDSPRTDGA